MLFTLEETSKKIRGGRPLHIAGAEGLLRRLPAGNWIGGSTEYFMAPDGGRVTDELLFVTEFGFPECRVETYGEASVPGVAGDAFENGFSIIILPFDSAVHRAYAVKAPEYEGMFIKNIAGWVSGSGPGAPGQPPIAVNGKTGEAFSDKAVAMHIGVPDDKMVSIGIVNIFSQDEGSPVFEFEEEGFSAKTCFVDGEEAVFADYIDQNGIDVRRPLVGDYSGAGVNTSFKSVENGRVEFFAPVVPGIKYRLAKPITDYVAEFQGKLKELEGTDAAFSCNCILNFMYGGLEGKHIEAFFGPVTYGEIAYQLVNQTLVYVSIA